MLHFTLYLFDAVIATAVFAAAYLLHANPEIYLIAGGIAAVLALFLVFDSDYALKLQREMTDRLQTYNAHVEQSLTIERDRVAKLRDTLRHEAKRQFEARWACDLRVLDVTVEEAESNELLRGIREARWKTLSAELEQSLERAWQ